MPNDKAKQHYVPQFYLKLFCPEANGDYVFCFDKKNKKSFRTNVRQVCYEMGFNEDAKKPSKPIEDAFAVYERECSKLFTKVISAQNLRILNVEEFANLCAFLLLFKQRTKKRRQIVAKARILWRDKINSQVTDWEVVPSSPNWEQSDHLLSIVDMFEEELPSVLKNDWELIVNETETPFWTSDDPLLQQLVKNDRRFNEPYVKNYFALTPSLLMHSQPLIDNSVSVTKRTITDKIIVNNMNRLMWDNALRFVISSEDNFTSVRGTMP